MALHTIRPEEAAQALAQMNLFKYKGFVEALLTKRPPNMESRILVTEGKPPSIVLTHRLPRDYMKTDIDAYVFIARDEDVGAIAGSLPEKVYLLMYDDETVSHIAEYLPVQFDGVRYHLHLPPDHQCALISGHEVIELTDEHESIVMASESPKVHNSWGFCMEFRDDFKAFAILEGGRLVSYCAIGPDRSSVVAVPIREVAYIYTETAYRRQGFAKTILSKVTQYLLDRGISAYYSVNSDNTASINTAKAVGYIQCGQLYGYYRA